MSTTIADCDFTIGIISRMQVWIVCNCFATNNGCQPGESAMNAQIDCLEEVNVNVNKTK
jgi:hypothetical protein